jgi:hypothetical protein
MSDLPVPTESSPPSVLSTAISETLQVRPDEKYSVTPGALRARRFRKGATHKANLARNAALRKLRKEKWLAERRKYTSLSFDGRDSGPLRNIGPISQFGKYDPELQGI